MSKILVIAGHPDLDKSYTNKVVLEQLEQNLADVDVRRLGQLYPDYAIDVAAEQAALMAADTVVLQFPFYWYSVPALLKLWIDQVFTFNFAYGPEGDKLKGKDFILSFTIGGPEESYQPLGYNHFTIEQMLYPLQQTAYLAGMVYHDPVYTHRMIYIPGVYNTLDAVESRAAEHAQRLLAQINRIQSDYQQTIEKFANQWFEQMDHLPEVPDYFLKHLGDDFAMDMPEGLFNGEAGFRDWYAQARQFFKPGCKHQIAQLDITPLDDSYQVTFRVRVRGESQQGDKLDLQVNETWRVQLAANGHVNIVNYTVKLV